MSLRFRAPSTENDILLPTHIALRVCSKPPLIQHGKCLRRLTFLPLCSVWAWPAEPLESTRTRERRATQKDEGLTRGPGFPSKPDAPCVVRWKHGWWVQHEWQEREISKWCWWINIIQTYSTSCDRVLEWVSHYYSMLVKNSHKTSRAWFHSHISVTSLTRPCLHITVILDQNNVKLQECYKHQMSGCFWALTRKYLLCNLLACFLICK